MPVQGKDAVTHHLTGLAAGVGKAHAIDHVVQAALKNGEQIGAGHALGHVGGDEIAVELIFQHTVHAAHLLLFTQLKGILADLLARAAVLAGGIGTAILGTLVGEAAVAFQKQLGAFAAAQAAFGVIIFGHGRYSSSSGR